MSMNSFGHLFRVTTWGESHGPALGATIDGCPPGVTIDEGMIQHVNNTGRQPCDGSQADSQNHVADLRDTRESQ